MENSIQDNWVFGGGEVMEDKIEKRNQQIRAGLVNGIMDRIMPVLEANNNPTNIEMYLKHELTKLYDEGFYQGTMNILTKEQS